MRLAEPFEDGLRLIDMGIAPGIFSDYRTAFSDFARKVQQARALMAAANPDWQRIDAALLDLEKARVAYNHYRDLLAQELSTDKAPAHYPLQLQANRVREIAEMRWELAGKPEGTDDDNWYRAEEIVRLAAAA
jgi:hypothetical protein